MAAGALDDEDVAVGLEHFGPPEVDHPPRPGALEEDVVGPDMGLAPLEKGGSDTRSRARVP